MLTLRELERWLAIEIGERYHRSEHRGLSGGTPLGAWKAQSLARPVRHLAAFHAAFLPAISRTVRRGSIQFNHVHYWHPQLSSFVGKDRQIVVHFDPADLGKLYWVLKNKTLIEIPYAQTHRPSVSLWELYAANQYLRRISRSEVNEERLFRAIEAQRRIVVQASAKTRKARLAANHPADRKRARAVLNESRNLAASKSPIDYSKPPEDLPVEILPGFRRRVP